MITPQTASNQPIPNQPTPNKNSNFYALLIGINHYHPNNLYPNLKGCVRDVDLVNAYLQNALGIPKANIWKLIGSDPDDLAPDDLAPDDPSLENTGSTSLPSTYRSIVESFRALAEKAAPGDQVYIHYSGHGGRAKTLYPRIKGLEQPDESIVPTDFCAPGGRYLRDVEIATLLKQMTDKGLIVTIVLDSCHSGGATRGDDCAIRGGEQIDFAEQPTESLVAPPETLERNWQALTQGTPSVPHSAWLPQAREYVCIAACRPSESAYEYAANGQERNGALTFWLIDTLTNNKLPDLDYRSLYECVSAKIQSRFPNQLPMLMGEENRVVFGTDLASQVYSVPVLDVNLAKRQVTLKVGLAQGISRGSRFAIYPLGTTDFLTNDAVNSQRLAVMEVRRLAAASCVAAIMPPAQGEPDLKAQLAAVNLEVAALVGAPAVMESTPVDLKRRVRLVDDKAVGDREFELPADLASQQVAALQQVRQALAGNGWITEFDGGKEAHYQVAINRTGAYEICIGLPLKNLRPPVMPSEPDGAKKVVERLVHLAKYQLVQALENRVSRLANSLQVDLMQQPDWQPGDPYRLVPFEHPDAIEVAVGSFAFLKIVNQSQVDLNVAILDLEPTWAISKVSILDLSASFYAIAPGEEQIIPLQFELPSGPDDQPLYQQATEVLKVFAALGPADFSSLELPPLDHPSAPKSLTRSSTRGGAGVGNSELNRLLSAISAESPTLTRAATTVRDPNQAWTTKQIRFTLTQS